MAYKEAAAQLALIPGEIRPYRVKKWNPLKSLRRVSGEFCGNNGVLDYGRFLLPSGQL